ncbi:MAG: uS17 family ribosomal protein [Candidatus Peribacteraceae bacterium]|jgi:small subunit ribosomal protein S17
MRTKKGLITSAKMQDTVTVTVHRSMFHSKYKKRYSISKKFLADSKGFDLAVGDEVLITECRPLSKRKYFRVTEVTKHAPRVSELAEEKDLTAVTQRTQKTSDSPDSPQ